MGQIHGRINIIHYSNHCSLFFFFFNKITVNFQINKVEHIILSFVCFVERLINEIGTVMFHTEQMIVHSKDIAN